MIIKKILVGSMGANCYVVGCEETKKAAVLDPGGEPREILDFVEKNGLTVLYIIDTHGHIDHIAGNDQMREATGAKLLIHELDANMLENPKLNLSAFMGYEGRFKPADQLLTDGDVIEIGTVNLEVIHTPGHTRGGICLVTEGAVFTGDTLFSSSIGRTDFPGGDYDTIINSIKTKLVPLGDELAVYPGHMGASTIAQERKHNPFLK